MVLVAGVGLTTAVVYGGDEDRRLEVATDRRDEPVTISLPTVDFGGSVEQARGAGVVALDGNNCVVLETGGATQLSTIWPHGYTASVRRRLLTIYYDAQRRPVADGGATIETSGGFHTVTDQHTVQNGTGTVPIIGGSHDCTPARASPS